MSWPLLPLVVFAIPMAGVGAAATNGTITEEVAVTLGPAPEGGVPVAVPVLEIEPLVTSAWVVVYVAVQVSVEPGERELLGQLILDSPDMGSVTVTELRVTLPVSR